MYIYNPPIDHDSPSGCSSRTFLNIIKFWKNRRNYIFLQQFLTEKIFLRFSDHLLRIYTVYVSRRFERLKYENHLAHIARNERKIFNLPRLQEPPTNSTESRDGKTTSLLNAWLIYSTLLFEFLILLLNNISISLKKALRKKNRLTRRFPSLRVLTNNFRSTTFVIFPNSSEDYFTLSLIVDYFLMTYAIWFVVKNVSLFSSYFGPLLSWVCRRVIYFWIDNNIFSLY